MIKVILTMSDADLPGKPIVEWVEADCWWNDGGSLKCYVLNVKPNEENKLVAEFAKGEWVAAKLT